MENKQKFIGQIMTSKSPVRSAEDVDEQALSYAEIKALATGNPAIKEKMDLDIDVSRLKLLKSNYLSQKYDLEDKLAKYYPNEIKRFTERIEGYGKDIQTVKKYTPADKETFFPMVIKGRKYTDKKEAGEALIAVCKEMTNPDPVIIGTYRGFEMTLSFESFTKQYQLALKDNLTHIVVLGSDIRGNLLRIDNALASMPEKLETVKDHLENMKEQMKAASIQVEMEFPQESELQEKMERLNELNAVLNMDEKEAVLLDDGEKAEWNKKEGRER